MAFFWFDIRSGEYCYSMKFDLLTNATVVDDVIRFVSDRSKEKVKEQAESSPSSFSDISNEDDKEEPNESEYNEDKDQLEEDQEEKTTTNQIF
jgi:hypothetical protein